MIDSTDLSLYLGTWEVHGKACLSLCLPDCPSKLSSVVDPEIRPSCHGAQQGAIKRDIVSTGGVCVKQLAGELVNL